MKKIIALLVSLIFASLNIPASAATCTINEARIVGGWEQASRIADYAVMAFEQDGKEHRFDSWRHNRPEVSQGIWKFENCQLTIWADPGDAKRRAEFLVLDATAVQLRLRDSEGRESIYSKIVEPTVRRKLITSSFAIQILGYCDKGNVTCDNVDYVGTSKKTGKSIRLHGKSQHKPCADG